MYVYSFDIRKRPTYRGDIDRCVRGRDMEKISKISTIRRGKKDISVCKYVSITRLLYKYGAAVDQSTYVCVSLYEDLYSTEAVTVVCARKMYVRKSTKKIFRKQLKKHLG